MKIPRFQARGFPEFLSRQLRLPGLQKCVSKVFPDIGPVRGNRHCFLKEDNRRIVIAPAKGLESFCQGFICSVRRLRERAQRNQEHYDHTHGHSPSESVSKGVPFSQVFMSSSARRAFHISSTIGITDKTRIPSTTF